jgi:hypothetical protein
MSLKRAVSSENQIISYGSKGERKKQIWKWLSLNFERVIKLAGELHKNSSFLSSRQTRDRVSSCRVTAMLSIAAPHEELYGRWWWRVVGNIYC